MSELSKIRTTLEVIREDLYNRIRSSGKLAELHARTGISKPYLSRILNSKQDVKLETLLEIAEKVEGDR